MTEAKTTEHRLARLLGLGLIAVVGFRALWIGLGPDARLLGFVPDDAFYYFGLANGFASLKEWTFDSGFSSGSGFHLMHAYFNVLVLDRLGPEEWRTIIGINFAVAWLAISIGLGLMTTALYRRFGLWGVIGCMPVVFSRNFMLSTTAAISWSWSILASSVFIFAVQSKTDSRFRWIVVFGAGLVGSVARFDFGGLPLVWTICAFAAWWFERDAESRERFVTSTIGLAGSSIATLASLIHHWVHFGDPLPASAQVKGIWASLAGGKFQSRLFMDLLGTNELPLDKALSAVFLGLAAYRIFVWLRAPDPQVRQKGWLGLAAGLTIVFYIGLYSRSAGVQIWYTQNFAMATLWLVASTLAAMSQHLRRRSARALVIVSIGVLSAFNFAASLQPLWPWQISMKVAGSKLAGRDGLGRIGAWNAGIVGFFQGGHVVNLDGLVNDEILPHLKQGSLACYLQRREIKYLADFDVMLLPGGEKAKLGGYADGALIAAATPIDVLAEPVDRDGRNKWSRASHVLYRLEWDRSAPLECELRADSS